MGVRYRGVSKGERGINYEKESGTNGRGVREEMNIVGEGVLIWLRD